MNGCAEGAWDELTGTGMEGHGLQIANCKIKFRHGSMGKSSLALPFKYGSTGKSSLALPFKHGSTGKSSLALPFKSGSTGKSSSIHPSFPNAE
eukprot:356953-Chlamydomonas_euryale.AAC.1